MAPRAGVRVRALRFVRRRGRLWLGLQLGAWLAFGAYRVYESVAFAPAVWQDSEAYMAEAGHAWLSGALWAGMRAPGTPALMKLTGHSYPHYVVFQAVLGALAWGFLAWVAPELVAPGWRATVVSWAVLGFATAPLVVQWDWSALSESPSLSALAVLGALGILLVRRFTWVRLVALAAAALVYEALRDAEIWGVAVVAVVLLAAGALRTVLGAGVRPEGWRATVRANLAGVRRVLVTGGALLAVSVLCAVAGDVSHRNVINMEDVFEVRVFPDPARLAWFARHGMPEARQVTEQAATTVVAPGMAKLVIPDLTASSWRPLLLWLEHEAQRTYVLYLATHPGYVLTAPFTVPALTFNDASGQLQFYEPPHRALPGFETVFAPGKVVVLVEAVLALLVAQARRVWRGPAWRFLAAFVVVGLLTMLVSWHGDGQEVTRHMLEGDVEVRLGVLLGLVLAVLAPGEPVLSGRRPG